MLKAIALILLAATTNYSFAWKESQALTRAAPNATTHGFPLDNARAVRVTLCAASGMTLSGAGTLESWYLKPGGLATDWSLGNVTLTVPAGAAGKRCTTFPDAEVYVRAGRGLWATKAVTVSGGTTVEVAIDVSTAAN